MAARKTAGPSTAQKTLPLQDRVIRAALDLAAAEGWEEVTFQALAKKCRCKLADLREIFEDRADLFAAYSRSVDLKVLQRIAADGGNAERDRLFDILMERFDVLNEDREAVLSILRGCCKSPKEAGAILPHLGRSMVWMLEAAGIDANGPRGALISLGLGGVYLYTLRAWMGDDSEDLAKTMAALDRGLERAEKMMGILG